MHPSTLKQLNRMRREDLAIAVSFLSLTVVIAIATLVDLSGPVR